MKKFFIIAATVAALAIPTLAMAAPAPGGGTLTCNVSLPAGSIASNVTVPAGTACTMDGNTTIQGNVTVAGQLKAFGGTFQKNVNVVQGGQFQGINYGVTILGNLSFVNPA